MSWAATFFKTILSYLFIILLTACHAHYPVNQSITSVDAIENYSLEKESEESASERSEELLLILTFSGGGTRAAGFSYGILEALADTEIMIDGKRRRLVDEIDVISSVSGGSFTAAYFGLFGDRIFEDFETKFLKFNVQGELFGRMLSPFSWPKLASLFYERSELAADYYDELLFENKTFGGHFRFKRAPDRHQRHRYRFRRPVLRSMETNLLPFVQTCSHFPYPGL